MLVVCLPSKKFLQHLLHVVRVYVSRFPLYRDPTGVVQEGRQVVGEVPVYRREVFVLSHQQEGVVELHLFASFALMRPRRMVLVQGSHL